MNARERILAKLRAAAPVSSPAAPSVADYYGVTKQAVPLAERAARFKANLDAAHAEVMLAPATRWPALLALVLRTRGIHRLLLDHDEPHAAALRSALPPDIATLAFDRPIEAWKSELFETVDAGFTVADAGIAATGTLIFRSGPTMPRTASLVPPLHIALVHAERIHPDLHTAATTDLWTAAMPTNLIMVSGPSKTSDIQQTLAYGAHGPKEMIVVVVMPDEEASA